MQFRHVAILASVLHAAFSNDLPLSRTLKMPNGAMPIIGLGTADAQAQGPPFTCTDAVVTALQVGYRHIDTAVFYQNHGDIAEGIKRSGVPREEIWITSKIAMHGAMLDLKGGLPGRNTTLAFVDDMLAQLKTTYVDLVLTHFPNIQGVGLKVRDGVEMEASVHKSFASRKEIWQTLESLVRDRKIRNIGVSNYLVPHLEEMSLYATIMPAVNQLEIHPYLPRKDVRDWCEQNNVVVEAYGSLVQDIYPDLLSEPVVKEIAAARGATPAQVALAWALHKGIVILPKSSKPARIRENAEALLVDMSDEDIESLDALDCASRTDCRFPTRCGDFCSLGTYYWDPSLVPSLAPGRVTNEL